MRIKGYKKSKDGRKFYMLKTTQKKEMDYVLDIIENESSNDWEDLCNKCSSIIKDSKMTDEDIDSIVNKCKKG